MSNTEAGDQTSVVPLDPQAAHEIMMALEGSPVLPVIPVPVLVPEEVAEVSEAFEPDPDLDPVL